MSDSSQPTSEPRPAAESSAAAASSGPETASVIDTVPKEPESPAFGWNAYAERTNGRFAMVGFVVLLIQELITRQDFWTWIGF